MGLWGYFYQHRREVLHQWVSQEKMYVLEAQVKQLGFQAAQDCERLTKDKTLTLQLLHKVSVPEDAHSDATPEGLTLCF